MKELNDFLKSMTFDFFGSGKHKINSTTFLAENNTLFLDVRSHDEFASLSFTLKHHMPALHIPIDEIPDRVNEIPKDSLIGIFCPTGVRATMVYTYLKILGYPSVRILEGGYDGLTAELKPGKLLKKINNK